MKKNTTLVVCLHTLVLKCSLPNCIALHNFSICSIDAPIRLWFTFSWKIQKPSCDKRSVAVYQKPIPYKPLPEDQELTTQ